MIERAAVPTQQDAGAYVAARLEKIVIPIIDFEDISVEEAVDFLRMRSFELEEGPPERRGVSWIIKKPSSDIGDKSAAKPLLVEPNNVPKINYRAKDVGLLTAMEEIARQAHLDVYLTNVGIVICRPSESPLPVGKMDGEEVWKTIHKEVLPHTGRAEGEQVGGGDGDKPPN